MLEKLRIGNGFDVHAFAKDRPLIIGGHQIEHEMGLAGHSDADVLVHAVVDSLLGAMGMGDIGEHFSSKDARWEGANSMDFLAWTLSQMQERSISLIYVDSTLLAQAPMMKPHIPAIREKLAGGLQCELEKVHVKATTTDHLGFLGRKEGMAAYASCLLKLP